MPNWVKNSLYISGDEKEEQTFKKLAASPDSILDFNNFVPMPENIYQGNLGPEEIEKYGTENWYDWRIEHWGTKWDADNVRFSDVYPRGISYLFQTANGSPFPVVREMSRLFPTLIFNLSSGEAMLDLSLKCIFKGGEIMVVWNQKEDGIKIFGKAGVPVMTIDFERPAHRLLSLVENNNCIGETIEKQ